MIETSTAYKRPWCMELGGQVGSGAAAMPLRVAACPSNTMHAARRHRIPRARYRVTNWPAYEAGLKRRGDLTLWLDQVALAGWAAPGRTTPGGQPLYSDVAIELVLTLRLVFHLALRQAEAFTRSLLRLLRLELGVPDHTTLCRRGRAFAGRRPRGLTGSHPVHLVLDSTGLQLFGKSA